MTSQLQRSRSPSAGTAGRIKRSNSASPQAQLAPSSTAAEVDSSSSNPLIGLDVHVAAGPFGDDTSFAHRDSHQAEWAPLGPRYSAIDQKEQAQARPLAADITNHTFLQSADFSSQADFGPGAHGSKHLSANALSQGHSPSNTADSSAFPSFDFDQAGYGAGAPPDPSVLEHIDAGVFNLLSSQQGGAKAAGQLEPMAAMQSHSPTPPHLLPDMVHHQSGSPSPHASPGFQQAPFHGMNRPRNTSESLDPSSAMFPLGQGDWSAMGSYRGHRRTPSDNYSDISSHSNQNSPYMPNLDNFDDPSPMLNSNQDPTFGGNVDLQRFSLSEPQSVPPPQYISPAHSPHPSPQLVAQKALPPFTAENNYGLQVTVNGQFGQPQNGGLEMFPGVSQEPFPSLNHTSPGELGAADQMSPPEISIDFAPESKSPFGNQQSRDGDALSPPQSNQSRNRKRAKSESHAGSRSASPALPGRGRSPSLQPQGSFGSNTLSPFDNNPSSRSPSPGRGRNGSLGGHARSSSNASDQRDYILDLAIPERTPSNGADNRRMQKHPATFCCHLCSKRFTRAYNLRSHLRTHTDERPYVCTICGKAFARQHDRKRHEGLHSGEKKYVCLGSLQSQQRWGCGRRFARADALGRHFRSEAGRVCIKPLLEEEAAERQKAWMEKQQQQQQQSQIAAAGLVATQPMLNQSSMDTMGSFLPAALLQQYPALAGIDWNSLQQGPTPEEDYAGRSSFDASSGGEYYDEFSENEMGAYPDALMTDMGAMPGVDMNQPMTMDQAQTGAAQGYGVYCGGNQTGDYLSDFDGR